MQDLIRVNVKRSLLIMRIYFFLYLLLMSFLFAATCLAESEMFKLRNRRAVEVLPMVEALLSPQGRAAADRIGNIIIVNDSPEVIREIRTLLQSSDHRMPQVRVQIAFASNDSEQGVHFEKSGRHLSTEDTLERYAKSGRRSRGSSFIMVSSGSSGYIRMAREVPVTNIWLGLCSRYGVPYLLNGTKTIETGMEVSPVAAGDQVIVTVTPRISWRERGKVDSYRFVDAATRVTIPRSKWVDLGGIRTVSKRKKDILGIILSTGESSSESGLYMRLKADITE